MFEGLTPLSDAKEAAAYFEKSLVIGNAMSARLLRQFKFETGKFFLPFDYSPPPGTNLGFRLDDPALDIARTHIKDVIIAHTRADKRNAFVVEDRIARKSERGLRQEENNIIYHENDVYNLYRQDNVDEASLNYMIEIALQNWTTSAFVRFDDSLKTGDIDIDATPWQVDAVCVGAFDDMALIFWTPA